MSAAVSAVISKLSIDRKSNRPGELSLLLVEAIEMVRRKFESRGYV